MDDVLFEELPGQDGNLGLITLNRPQALNALTHKMIFLIHQKLLEWEDQQNLKAVVIRAAEGKAFCAGGDLRFIYEKHKAKDLVLGDFFADEYRLNHYIYHYPKPYIAFLDGITMGGGAGLSLHGSHRLGTERLLFAMPETSIGFFPDIGASYFLSRLPKGVGFYLGLTGARIDCDDCMELQLIDYKVLSTNLNLILKKLADTPFNDNPYERVSLILDQFKQSPLLSPLIANYELINQYLMKSSVEEILLGLEADANPWCHETIALLKQKSPTSLKVTLEQLHQGLKRDFDQCMQLEYHLMGHFIQGHDFFEGIRALIVEKDQKPRWQPAALSDISQQSIEELFRPLTGDSAKLLFT